MIELHEVGLVEGLPPDVAKEPWVQILDAVFRERRKKELEAAERLKIYTDIDRADEAVLDILAVQFRVDWYDTSYPIETKRRIIKTALEVRRYCGTEWAVQKALSSIYPNVKISEWYDYGGRPGYWRMNVDITDDGVIYYTPEEIEKRLGYARRCTAHLEHIIYIVEPHERSPAYIAAAPCGMATSCTVKIPGRIKPREIGAKAYVAGAVGRSKMQVAVALPGAALLSESLSGGALVITRAVSGTGTADADLSGETGVSGETHDLKLLNIETVESGGETARRVKIQITGADETYIMHQVGVYGRLNDDAETLLFIMQDARGVEVPSTKVNGDFEIELSALLAVSNKANISITVDPQMQALAKLVKAEIEKHNAAADAHAATITAAVSAAVKNLSESGEILNEEQVKVLIKEQVDGGTGGGYYGSYELTLAADGWKPARSEDDYENAGGMDYYQCIYDAELSDSTSELVPVGVVSPGSFYTTTKAGVLNGCETHDGFIRFFAQRIPEADIQATVTLFGKGGGSGETGSVSIGQGLKRDASGAIAVRIGEGLDFDSANALTVRKETVMTSEDLLDEEETQQEIVDMLK